jgi:hypothetical protein
MDRMVSGSRKFRSRACVVALLFSIPPAVWLLDLPGITFAGCSGYGGYGCSQVACFGLEVTTDQGATWRDGTVYIYGAPGATVLVHVRTLLGVISGSIEGWQFSVRHNASSVTGAPGGAFDLVAAQNGSVASLQCGSNPDFVETRIRPCGYTQGVCIDYDSTACKVNAPATVVTSKACYSVKMPTTMGVYPVTLQFTDDVGDPPIQSIVTQNGLSKVPCKFNLTLNMYSNPYYTATPSYCPLSPQTPVACGSDGGGAGGGNGDQRNFFRRGDGDNNGAINLSDAVFVLNFLFRGGPAIPCRNAGDSNDDSAVNITDPIFLLRSLFLGGPQPPAPGATCGLDPTEPQALGCDDSLCGPDTDGDGFSDRMESGDDLVDGLNLADFGADPAKPDIFVEIDWFSFFNVEGSQLNHEHKPLPLALELVVEAFANAPPGTVIGGVVANQGINLHIDAGAGLSFNIPAGTPLRGAPIAFVGLDDFDNESFFTQDPTLNSENLCPIFERIEALKGNPANFDQNRRNIFHYCIFAHTMHNRPEAEIFPLAGIAEGIFTDDFVVTISTPADPFVPMPENPDDSTDPVIVEQAATFMHELGHTLNLRHGGNEDPASNPDPADDGLARKRNYRSVMNLLYGAFGRDTNCDSFPDAVVNYSDELLDPLIEMCLDETKGICVVNGDCLPQPCETIDFNGNGNIQPPCVMFDLSRDFDCGGVGGNACDEVIAGWDDWRGGALRLEFQISPDREGCGAGNGGGASLGSEGLLCAPDGFSG